MINNQQTEQVQSERGLIHWNKISNRKIKLCVSWTPEYAVQL